MRRWWWLLAATTALSAACGAGDEPTESVGTRLAASDGSAVLIVPEGALPSGVEAGSLTLTSLETAAPPGDQSGIVAAYRMGPDGLVFDEAATLEVPVTLDATQGVQVMSLGDTPELIIDLEVVGDRPATGTADVTLRIPIQHFSEIRIRAWATPRATLLVTPDPETEHPIGTQFSPTATAVLGPAANDTDSFTWEHQGRKFTQTVEVTVAATGEWQETSGLAWTGDAATPARISAKDLSQPGDGRTHRLISARPFTCQTPGEFEEWWDVAANVSVEVLITHTWQDTGEEFFRLERTLKPGDSTEGMIGAAGASTPYESDLKPPLAYRTTGKCVTEATGGEGEATTTTPPPEDCQLDESDAAIPSIGRTGAAAVETGLVPEELEARSYDIGFVLRTLVEDGLLCAEDLIAMYEDGTVSEAMGIAIEIAIAEVQATPGAKGGS